MIEITLLGNPKSSSHIYRFHSRGGYMTKEGKAIKEDYILQAKQQYKGKPLKGDLFIEIALYFGDKRKRDWDNYHKLSMDALNDIVWEDDVQIQKATVIKGYDKENPRIEIEIEI